jgi:hypothetical protein
MTAQIITVFNQKGGVGKTTTTCQLAGTLGYRGFDVLVADMDPQETSSSWISNGPEGFQFPATLWACAPCETWTYPTARAGCWGGPQPWVGLVRHHETEDFANFV